MLLYKLITTDDVIMKDVRFVQLDGLRGIAVLIVFLSHTSGRQIMLHPVFNFAGIGHVGVYLFFCLSAFLLSKKLFEENIDTNSVKRFIIKRFFRIVPLYFLVIILLYVIQNVTGYYNKDYLHISDGNVGFIQHLLFYRGDGVFWSVVVEEQFYIIVPLCIFLFIRFRYWAIIIFSFYAIINFLLYTSKSLQFPLNVDWIKYITTNYRQSGNYHDVFFCTVIFVYFFISKKMLFEKIRKKIAFLANFFFISFLILTFCLVSKKFLFFDRPFYGFRFLSLLYSLVFSLFIVSVYFDNPINRFLKSKCLTYIGKFGFSIYLLHMAVFEFVNYIDIASPLKFMLSFSLVFLVGYLGYRLIELPSIQFSHFIINKFNMNKFKMSYSSSNTSSIPESLKN